MRKEFVTLILILFCLFLFCGCIEHYDYKQYQVKVIDAEQDKPVGGASITIRYLGFKKPVLNPPKAIEVTTDANGSTELRIADYTVAIGAVSTDGYLPFRFSCHSKELIVNGKKWSNGEIVIPIYQEPAPEIKIIVPDNYRGPVALHFIPTEERVQEEVGKRLFSYKILPNGYVPVWATPLFNDINTLYSIKAEYESGKTISRTVSENIGFRLVDSTVGGLKNLYIIGTKKDYEELHDKIWPFKEGEGLGRHFDRDVFNSYFEE